MVYYSLDANRRQPVIYGMAVVSVAAASFLQSRIPSGLSAPSALTVFGVLFWVFDCFLWRLWPVNRLVGIPHLAGRWWGTLRRTVWTGQAHIDESVDVVLTITQTWSRMDLVLENAVDQAGHNLRSTAEVVGLKVENPDVVTVKWIYRHQTGEGVTELRLLRGPDGDMLRGDYYSSKLRAGDISLKRVGP